MHFGRLSIDLEVSRKPLPIEWTEEFTRTLTEAYFDQSEKDNSFFDVHGEIYDKEFVVIISYLNHDDLTAAPISLFISHDVVEDSKQFTIVLKNLIDLSSHVLDDIFATESWHDYVPNWTESKFKDSKFFYKITRENISLTIQAQQFLDKEGMV